MRSFLRAALCCTLLAPATAFAAPRPVVVELFTSQGCSSCPPADKFLTELAQSRQDILVLAFHVTYWNYLGWRDPYGLESATERQTHYAARLSDGKLFTPHMVVDGTRGLWGSNRGEAVAAIQAAKIQAAKTQAAKTGDRAGTALTLTRSGDRLKIAVGGGGGEGRVLLVGFDHEHRTAIGRGENRGRTLLESNIVRSLAAVGSWNGAAMTVEADAPAGESFAVLLQAADGRIIGAATLAS